MRFLNDLEKYSSKTGNRFTWQDLGIDANPFKFLTFETTTTDRMNDDSIFRITLSCDSNVPDTEEENNLVY